MNISSNAILQMASLRPEEAIWPVLLPLGFLTYTEQVGVGVGNL